MTESGKPVRSLTLRSIVNLDSSSRIFCNLIIAIQSECNTCGSRYPSFMIRILAVLVPEQTWSSRLPNFP